MHNYYGVRVCMHIIRAVQVWKSILCKTLWALHFVWLCNWCNTKLCASCNQDWRFLPPTWTHFKSQGCDDPTWARVKRTFCIQPQEANSVNSAYCPSEGWTSIFIEEKVHIIWWVCRWRTTFRAEYQKSLCPQSLLHSPRQWFDELKRDQILILSYYELKSDPTTFQWRIWRLFGTATKQWEVEAYVKE